MANTKWLLIPLLALALTANAQTVVPQIEIGYRWLDLNGNSDVYRSQINERSGLLLRSFTYNTTETPFGDRFRLDATDLGVGPAGSLRLETGRTGSYRLNLHYRRADAFSAIPTFALGQHTIDRQRKALDVDLELLRFSKFTPFIGYSDNRYDGPGTTTYHVGQDEFLLQQSLHDHDREVRIGTRFELGPVQGQLTQGWRRFRGSETLTLAPGGTSGNNIPPVLGHPIEIGNFAGDERTSVRTPFTNLFITGMATSRVRLIGNYVRFAADSSGSSSEDLTGSLASFALSRFFNGLGEQTTARANNTTWRGGARAEVELWKGIDMLVSWQRESRELSGTALVNTLFIQSVTFGGADPSDVQTVLDSSNSLDRKEDAGSITFSARSLGPFSLRAGFSTSKQDVTVTPDLAEIVLAGNQGGTFNRRVNTFDVDGAFAKAGFTAGAAWKRSNADDPILRTDFLHRDRIRLRAGWQAPKWVRAGVSAQETRQDNDRPDTSYDAKLREYTGEVEVTPLEVLSLRASASRFRSDSNIFFRRPENFTIDESVHIERGSALQGGFSLALPRFTIDGDVSRFTNRGTLPFRINRTAGRATFPIYAKFGMAAEWSRDTYREEAYTAANYEANRYGLFLRFTP
ncbi:MAG: hypothetical protein QOI24_4044 [Acidobacteriota bacterium]|jgi:hypothetical protein|nr:hypothetical protein [Acidobacteriota bacterium]